MGWLWQHTGLLSQDGEIKQVWLWTSGLSQPMCRDGKWYQVVAFCLIHSFLWSEGMFACLQSTIAGMYYVPRQSFWLDWFSKPQYESLGEGMKESLWAEIRGRWERLVSGRIVTFCACADLLLLPPMAALTAEELESWWPALCNLQFVQKGKLALDPAVVISTDFVWILLIILPPPLQKEFVMLNTWQFVKSFKI